MDSCEAGWRVNTATTTMPADGALRHAAALRSRNDGRHVASGRRGGTVEAGSERRRLRTGWAENQPRVTNEALTCCFARTVPGAKQSIDLAHGRIGLAHGLALARRPTDTPAPNPFKRARKSTDGVKRPEIHLAQNGCTLDTGSGIRRFVCVDGGLDRRRLRFMRVLLTALGVGPGLDVGNFPTSLHLFADGTDRFVINLHLLGDLAIGLLRLRPQHLGDQFSALFSGQVAPV